jgi:hypothetical protein
LKGDPMVRYYFHIRDGWDLIPDDEGIECPTWEAAHAEAYASASDLSRTSHSRACSVQVTDEAGNVLETVEVPIAA